MKDIDSGLENEIRNKLCEYTIDLANCKTCRSMSDCRTKYASQIKALYKPLGKEELEEILNKTIVGCYSDISTGKLPQRLRDRGVYGQEISN